MRLILEIQPSTTLTVHLVLETQSSTTLTVHLILETQILQPVLTIHLILETHSTHRSHSAIQSFAKPHVVQYPTIINFSDHFQVIVIHKTRVNIDNRPV